MRKVMIDDMEYETFMVDIPVDMLPLLDSLCDDLNFSVSDYLRFSVIYAIDRDYKYLASKE